MFFCPNPNPDMAKSKSTNFVWKVWCFNIGNFSLWGLHKYLQSWFKLTCNLDENWWQLGFCPSSSETLHFSYNDKNISFNKIKVGEHTLVLSFVNLCWTDQGYSGLHHILRKKSRKPAHRVSSILRFLTQQVLSDFSKSLLEINCC